MGGYALGSAFESKSWQIKGGSTCSSVCSEFLKKCTSSYKNAIKKKFIYILKYWTPSNNIEHPSWYPEHPAASFSSSSSSSSPPLLFLCPFFLRSFTFCFAETAVSYFIFFVLCACLLCVWPLSFHVSTMCMSKTKFLPMWTMSM